MTLRTRRTLQMVLVILISVGIFIWWIGDTTEMVKKYSTKKLIDNIDLGTQEVSDTFKDKLFINSTTTAEFFNDLLQATSTVTSTE